MITTLTCRISYFLSILTMLCYSYCIAEDSLAIKRDLYRGKTGKIIIELKLSRDYYKLLIPNASREVFEIYSVPFGAVPNHQLSTTTNAHVSKGIVKWVLYSDKPLSLGLVVLGTGGMVYPGDSIHIDYTEKGPVYSGKGVEGLRIFHEMNLCKKGLEKPAKRAGDVNSLKEYLKWDTYLDSQLRLLMPLIDSYKNKLPKSAFNFIKRNAIKHIENDRIDAFSSLLTYSQRENTSGLTLKNLASIFDSTQYKPWAKWLRSTSDIWISAGYFYQFTRYETWRKFDFDLNHDSINSPGKRRLLYYNIAKQNYKGILRERLMQYIIVNQVINELGFKDSNRAIILQDYYNQREFPEYKQWVKEYENKISKLAGGKHAPDFILADINGNEFTKTRLKGKMALIDFWFTGCKPCMAMTPILQKIENAYTKDSNIIFISISIDDNKDVWHQSISEGRYTTTHSIKLYTNGEGKSHPIIKDYNVTGFPELHLLSEDGRIIENPLPDPRKDDGKALMQIIDAHRLKVEKENQAIIKSKYVESIDGPYILYEKDSIRSYKIKDSIVTVNHFFKKTEPELQVQTYDSGKIFYVKLKDGLETEIAEYSKPKKLFVLSDIEGNFEAFRLLLVNNKIIDENFNWTFGKGHLVFAGDMFDRGNQVTECLWLIYSLEEKAKSAGGYVHFILGNHEIMNLQGDHRYTLTKYQNNAVLLGKTLVQLYNEDSELGKWLRTKNIIEKIGDLLFAHGGISPEITRMPLSISQINSLARPYYAGNVDSSKQQLLTIFNSKTSPFWFRGYYGDLDNVRDIPTFQQVDSSLQKFEVAHIVTGHTVRTDTISIWYDGKVINTDTKHVRGESEALLIEENNYYRVNAEGIRKLLFTDKKKETISSMQYHPTNGKSVVMPASISSIATNNTTNDYGNTNN